MSRDQLVLVSAGDDDGNLKQWSDGAEAAIVAALNAYAEAHPLPPWYEVVLSAKIQITGPSGEPATEPPDVPVCPGCGIAAIRTDHGWETAHPIDCSWMADPTSEPY